MTLEFAKQISLSELNENEFDVIITGCGYESRSVTLTERLNSLPPKKITLSFTERKDNPQRKLNDKFFQSKGFRSYKAREGDYEKIIEILKDIFDSDYISKYTELRVLVDYSCMTKVWYATIINYFRNRETPLARVFLTCSYTPSKFSEPLEPRPNKYVGPIPGIFRVSTSSKPTALIIGLGYERQSAKGIRDYLDPQLTYVFYTDPPLDDKFIQAVEKNNKFLLDGLSTDRIVKYPLNDLRRIDSQLTSLCLKLRNEYKVILAPLGPKPFGLMCLLLSVRFSDIDVWRVTAGSSGNTYDREAFDCEPIVCETQFVNEPIYDQSY